MHLSGLPSPKIAYVWYLNVCWPFHWAWECGTNPCPTNKKYQVIMTSTSPTHCPVAPSPSSSSSTASATQCPQIPCHFLYAKIQSGPWDFRPILLKVILPALRRSGTSSRQISITIPPTNLLKYLYFMVPSQSIEINQVNPAAHPLQPQFSWTISSDLVSPAKKLAFLSTCALQTLFSCC